MSQGPYMPVVVEMVNLHRQRSLGSITSAEYADQAHRILSDYSDAERVELFDAFSALTVVVVEDFIEDSDLTFEEALQAMALGIAGN